MTSVEIKYNPFKTKTEIIVNGDEIAKTSNLFRYRNTPLEDWVDVLIPELVEYCNDDEIFLNVVSIQKYIDDINDQTRIYSKKHRHVDIKVEEAASIGYKGRLERIKRIQEKMGAFLTVDESKSDIQVLVVSMAGIDEYARMLQELLDVEINSEEGYIISNFQYEEDGFRRLDISISELEDRFININLLVFPSLEECANKYWRILKEKVSQNEDYILLAQLNSKPKKNDELYGYISEQLEKKGKQSKSKFIFVSNNTEDNDDYLKEEYGVRNINILEEDDVASTLKLVKKYIQNVCYIKKIVNKGNIIHDGLQKIQSEIIFEAERNKSIAEIEEKQMEYRKKADLLVQHYNSITLKRCAPMTADELTENFIRDVIIQLGRLVVDAMIKDMNNEIEKEDSAFFRYEMHRLGSITVSAGSSYISLNEKLKYEIKECFEQRLRQQVYEYLSTGFELRAENTTFEEDIILEIQYPIKSIMEEVIDLKQICDGFISSLSEIHKRTESGSREEFFFWLVENIGYYDLGIYSSISFNAKNKKNYGYGAVIQKIKRRLNAIKEQINIFFANVVNDFGTEVLKKGLEEKKGRIEELIKENVSKVMQQIGEYEQQLNISDKDKVKLENIDDIILELRSTIEI